MQTFLPYPSFERSMQVLDDKRLGNQIYREALTLIRGKWANHPASKMWRGYESALALYGLEGLEELKRRGRDYPHHRETFESFLFNEDGTPIQVRFPQWIGNEEFHAAHRSNLLRKDPEWYGQFGWTEPDDLPYIWPVR